jgi:hypothetical protein
MKLTAATITDAQIREMRHATGWVGRRCEADQKMLGEALRGDLAARARCAEILNAHEAHCGGLLCAWRAARHCECDCDDCAHSNELLRKEYP